MLRARLPVFSFTSRSSQRRSGWLPASTNFAMRMVFRRLEAGSVDCRAGSLGQHARRGLAGETRLADTLGPGKQPGMVQRAALHERHENCSTARSWPTIKAAGPQGCPSRRCVTSSGVPEASMRRTRSGSSAATVESRARPCDGTRPIVRRCGPVRRCRGPWHDPRPRPGQDKRTIGKEVAACRKR